LLNLELDCAYRFQEVTLKMLATPKRLLAGVVVMSSLSVPLMMSDAHATVGASQFTVVDSYTSTPSAVAFDANNNRFVAFDKGPRDQGSGSILEYLASSPQSSVYASDGGNSSGLVFDSFTGQLIEVKPTNISGTTVFSVGANSLNYLDSIDNATGAAADSNGNIYVVTGVDGTVDQISSSNSVETITSGLANPTADLVLRNGNLLVGDCGAGSTHGNIFSIAIPGGAKQEISRTLVCPDGFAIGPNGALFASDFSTGILYRQAASGSFVAVVHGLREPEGMAFDSAGNLFVANSGAKQLIEVPVANIAAELQIKHQKASTTSKTAKISWTGSGFSTSTTCKLYRKSGAKSVKVGTSTVVAQKCSFAHLAKNSKYAVGVVATDGTLTGPTSWISFKTKVK